MDIWVSIMCAWTGRAKPKLWQEQVDTEEEMLG